MPLCHFGFPKEIVKHIVDFLPWSLQIKVLPELEKVIKPAMAAKIMKTMMTSRVRIPALLEEEDMFKGVPRRAAFCLYRGSDDYRASDIRQVTRYPKRFSRAVVSLVSVGICLEWPLKKLHTRMIKKMNEDDLTVIGW